MRTFKQDQRQFELCAISKDISKAWKRQQRSKTKTDKAIDKTKTKTVIKDKTAIKTL
jgi:hypothetical protein